MGSSPAARSRVQCAAESTCPVLRDVEPNHCRANEDLFLLFKECHDLKTQLWTKWKSLREGSRRSHAAHVSVFYEGWGYHLVHAVQELQENGREATALTVGTQVTPLAEFVAEGEPFFVQENLEAFQSPVERIAQQLHQRHHLQGEEKKSLRNSK